MTIRSARKRVTTRHERKPPQRKQGAPTIADVAAYAGFAPMTVSRVINGESNVRQETREAVQAAIAKLKYSPNLAARTLAGAEQIRIGLLYSNPSAAFLSEFLVGSLEQARLSHVQLVVEKCDADQHEDDVVRERSRRNHIAAAIIRLQARSRRLDAGRCAGSRGGECQSAGRFIGGAH